MTLDIEPVVDQKNLKPSLTVMGIGGAGSNAVNNMIQSNLNNVDFIVANTDAAWNRVADFSHTQRTYPSVLGISICRC